MSVSPDYFDKFHDVISKYLQKTGEGNTKGSQIITAVNKIIYNWYNNGDLFDNTSELPNSPNDLSSYANWLNKYTDLGSILEKVWDCESEDEYEELLKELGDKVFNEEYLSAYAEQNKEGSIYECDGYFKIITRYDEGDEEDEESEESEDEE